MLILLFVPGNGPEPDSSTSDAAVIASTRNSFSDGRRTNEDLCPNTPLPPEARVWAHGVTVLFAALEMPSTFIPYCVIGG